MVSVKEIKDSIKSRHIILAVLFILYFSIRLYFSLGTEQFGNDESYFALRQIDHIWETGKPIIHDDLSYGGRTFVLMPFYYYLLAFFTLFFPKIIIIKVINNLLASTLILGVYMVCSKILKNRRISILCSVIAATLPIYINATLNNISSYSILFPGSFFFLYFFLNLENDVSKINYLIPLILVLILTSSSSFLLILGILLFILLSQVENRVLPKIELEFTAFFLLFFLWASFIIYKTAFQAHGFSIIYQNAPQEVIKNHFVNLDILTLLANIGFLPLIFGVYSAYVYFFKKNKSIFLFISIFLSAFILLWLRLVSLELGLMFLGSSLVILFGQFLKDVFIRLNKSKIASKSNQIFILIVTVIVLTQILPGFIAMFNSPTFDEEYVSSFEWFNANTPNSSIILGSAEQGHLITYFGKRKNILDSNYLLIEDADKRFNDVTTFYNTRFKTHALKILDKYHADYFIVSYNSNLFFINDPCFDLLFDNEIRIYQLNKKECQ